MVPKDGVNGPNGHFAVEHVATANNLVIGLVQVIKPIVKERLLKLSDVT